MSAQQLDTANSLCKKLEPLIVPHHYFFPALRLVGKEDGTERFEQKFLSLLEQQRITLKNFRSLNKQYYINIIRQVILLV